MTQADPQLAEFQKAQSAEYETYVAVGPIDFGNARAFNEGDPVPASTVERLGLDTAGLVAKRTSAAGKKIVEATSVTVDLDEFHKNDVNAQALVDPDGVKAATVKPSRTAKEGE